MHRSPPRTPSASSTHRAARDSSCGSPPTDRDPRPPAVNEAIWDAMGPLSNGAVLDWDRLVPLDALSSDGIHPDVGQQGALASIVDPYLQGWLDAVKGGGATACQGSIRSHA